MRSLITYAALAQFTLVPIAHAQGQYGREVPGGPSGIVTVHPVPQGYYQGSVPPPTQFVPPPVGQYQTPPPAQPFGSRPCIVPGPAAC